MDIDAIKKLLNSGEAEIALAEISKLETSRLDTNQSIQVQLLKVDAYLKMSQFNSAIKLAEQIVQSSDKLSLTLEKIDALLHISHAKYRIGKTEESLVIVEQVRQEISNAEGFSSQDIAIREAKMINAEGTIYTERGEDEKAINAYKQSYEINKILDDKRGMAVALNNIASIYSNSGDYDLALETFGESVDIAKDINDEYVASVGIYNMAGLYQVKGELQKSLEYLDQSMDLNNKFGDELSNAYCFSAMGNVYEEMGKYQDAIESYIKGMDYFREIDHGGLLANSYLNLIVNYLAIRDSKTAKQYLQLLKEINERENSPIIAMEYKFAEGIILKTSKRFTERALAQQKFKEIVENPEIDMELASKTMLYLIESLFSELYESGDESILKEIQTNLTKLETMIQRINSYTLLVETYFIRSKLALINLDIDDAKRLLLQSQLIAEEKGLNRLAQRVSIETDNLVAHLEEWDNMLLAETPIEERLEKANIDTYVPESLVKSIEDNPKSIEDNPILLIIMRSGGITLYTNNFGNKGQDDFLIGAFLGAINSFFTKAFSTTGIIDIIRIKEYSLIMNSPFILDVPEDQKLTFCYMFKGYSYSARRKLNSFIEELEYKPIWELLVSKNFGLSSSNEEFLNQIAIKCFK